MRAHACGLRRGEVRLVDHIPHPDSHETPSLLALLRCFPAATAAALLLVFTAGADARATIILQGSGATYAAFEAEGNATFINGTPTTWGEKAEANASGGRRSSSMGRGTT